MKRMTTVGPLHLFEFLQSKALLLDWCLFPRPNVVRTATFLNGIDDGLLQWESVTNIITEVEPCALAMGLCFPCNRLDSGASCGLIIRFGLASVHLIKARDDKVTSFGSLPQLEYRESSFCKHRWTDAKEPEDRNALQTHPKGSLICKFRSDMTDSAMRPCHMLSCLSMFSEFFCHAKIRDDTMLSPLNRSLWLSWITSHFPTCGVLFVLVLFVFFVCFCGCVFFGLLLCLLFCFVFEDCDCCGLCTDLFEFTFVPPSPGLMMLSASCDCKFHPFLGGDQKFFV